MFALTAASIHGLSLVRYKDEGEGKGWGWSTHSFCLLHQSGKMIHIYKYAFYCPSFHFVRKM